MTRFNLIKRFILDIFYPNRCPLCGKIMKYDELICDSCVKEIKPTDDFCMGCGFRNCKCDKNKYYDIALSIGIYEGKLRKALLKLKEEKNNELLEFYSRQISTKIKEFDFDAIVFVPMTGKRKRKSGFNQAFELAKELSKQLRVPIYKNALFKVRDYSHHELSGMKRADAVKDAYLKGKSCDLKGKSILLADDIMTTGSTVNECARILKEMGAVFVAAVCVAKTDDIFDLAE